MKRSTLIGLKTLALLVLLAWVAWRVDWHDFVSALSRVGPLSWMGMVALHGVIVVLMAARMNALTRLRWIPLLRMSLVAYFFRLAAPGQVGSDVYRVVALANEMQCSKVRSGLFVVADRAIGAISLTVFAVAAALFAGLGARRWAGSVSDADAAATLGLVAVLAAACLVGIWWLRRTGRMVILRQEVATIWRELPAPRILAAFVISFLSYLAPFGMTLILMGDLGDVQLLAALAVPALTAWVTLIFPVSFSGIGVREAVGIVLFAEFGYTAGEALLMSSLPFVASLFVSAVGLLVMLIDRRPAERVESVTHRESQ